MKATPTLVFAAWTLLCSAASADSGTIHGKIQANDQRANPYLSAGHGAAPAGARQTFGGTQPLKQVLLHFALAGSAGVANRWTRTDNNGDYSLSWNVPGTVSVAVISVVAARPNIPGGGVTTSAPGNQFSVADLNTQVVLMSFNETGLTNNVNRAAPTRTITGLSDHLNAYRTAQEVYDLWDSEGTPAVGSSTRADCLGVLLSVEQGAGSGGVTPSDSLILLSTGTATSNPQIVAHELGHILAWRSLDQPLALIFTTDYFTCYQPDNIAWDYNSEECEKVAFHEGFASAHSALWMWYRSATPANFVGQPSTPRIIGDGSTGATQGVSVEGAASCATGSTKYRTPLCNLRAMWDVVDAPPTDDDTMTNRDLSDVVSAFRSYTRIGCVPPLDNHCNSEGSPYNVIPDTSGNNWKDYVFGHNAAFTLTTDGTKLDAIGANNGLSAQDDF